MAGFYIKKVEDLRETIKNAPAAPTPDWPSAAARGQTFSFIFASAGKVSKTIKGLKSTEALGVDGIPVSVLKKGVALLAAPLAHLVNRSLATGVVPSGFKLAPVFPVYKGGSKPRDAPASYRPVSILPAMSKIVETLVKSDLEGFLTATDALPRSQHGFRSGRSCTTALGNAHSGWLGGVRTGKVVGVIAYDLSAAFDTVAADRLLPKLERIGVKGTALAWFTDYLCGGRQSVVWNSGIGDFVGVRFRVRQGSILGPVLFLLHVADMAEYLGGNAKNSNLVYADDSNV
jgi:hypothetical protein